MYTIEKKRSQFFFFSFFFQDSSVLIVVRLRERQNPEKFFSFSFYFVPFFFIYPFDRVGNFPFLHL